jgi:hypothetical protein
LRLFPLRNPAGINLVFMDKSKIVQPNLTKIQTHEFLTHSEFPRAVILEVAKFKGFFKAINGCFFED